MEGRRSESRQKTCLYPTQPVDPDNKCLACDIIAESFFGHAGCSYSTIQSLKALK